MVIVSLLVLVVVGTLLIPFQTTVEEYVFRGYFMQGFANYLKQMVSISDDVRDFWDDASCQS